MTPMSGGPPNIGPRGRAVRLGAGAILLALGGLAGFFLAAIDAPLPLRACVFIPLFIGGLGLFQARAGTCVALAARGRRDLGRGEEPVADAGEASASRREARKILLKTLALAAASTLFFCLLKY